MKILVVDDVRQSVFFHSRLLELRGHQVLAADSGAAALDELKKHRDIDAVLTDLKMPEIDGVELFRRAHANAPVDDSGKANVAGFIMMTSVKRGRTDISPRDLERVELATKIGFLDVLHKPIDKERLFEVLSRYALQRKGQYCLNVDKHVNSMDEIFSEIRANQDIIGACSILEAFEVQTSGLKEWIDDQV